MKTVEVDPESGVLLKTPNFKQKARGYDPYQKTDDYQEPQHYD